MEKKIKEMSSTEFKDLLIAKFRSQREIEKAKHYEMVYMLDQTEDRINEIDEIIARIKNINI